MSQQHANESASKAHPHTFSTGVVTPDEDGIPALVATTGSNVQAVGFAEGAMFIQFQGGKVYRYTAALHPPPAEPVDMAAVHAGMMAAESKGGYFSKHLRANRAIECVYLGRVVQPAVDQQHENGDGV